MVTTEEVHTMIRKFYQRERTYSNRNSAMIGISINIPEIYNDAIKDLINIGAVPNRSAAIRSALRDFLHKEIEFFVKLRGKPDEKG